MEALAFKLSLVLSAFTYINLIKVLEEKKESIKSKKASS
jgi:hypothetical protein